MISGGQRCTVVGEGAERILMSGGVRRGCRCWLALVSIVVASCSSTGEPSVSSVGEGSYPVVEASAQTAFEYPVAGGDASEPGDAEADTAESSDQGGPDCLVDRFLFAGFIAGIASPQGLTIDRSIEPWPHLVVDLVGGVDVVFDVGPQASRQGMDRIELWPGIADELEILFNNIGDRDVHLMGRGFPPGDSIPSGSVLIEFIEDEVHAYESCREAWRDVTKEMALAVRALDATDPLDAVSKVIHGSYDTGGTFAQAWASAEGLNSVPWEDRAQTERAYADPDIPEETLDTLSTWRVHIAYPQVTVDGTVPYALCARQLTALTGSCFEFGRSLLTDEIVLKALVDPDLPVEILLVNEQSGDAFYSEPLATITDLDTPTMLTFFTTLGTDSGTLEAATAANSVEITVGRSTAELLANPERAGLEIIGDLGPFRDTGG